jgi:hypothetical protein
VAWNRPAQALFAGWLDQKNASKNLLRFMFCNPAAQVLVEQWEHRAARLVAEFRADCSSRLDDPYIKELLAELCAASAAFKRAWSRQDVVERAGGERKFKHPAKGPMRFEQLTFHVANRSDLKLVMLV